MNSVHRRDTRAQQTKLLHVTSHSHPQQRTLPVATSATLVGADRIIRRKENIPASAIVCKWCQTVRTTIGLVAAVVVETKAGAN